MQNEGYARPYAEAAYQTAKQDADVSSWQTLLTTLATLFSTQALQDLVHNPFVDQNKVVEALIPDLGQKLSAHQENFLRLLAENRRLAYLPEIASCFESLHDQTQGIIRVEVTSAFELDSQARTNVEKKLHDIFHKQTIMTTKVDPSLIGGLHIKAGDRVLDTSFKHRLNQLKHTLR
jgi:F-type H+-transporting ATPase subunit delta